MPTIDIKFQRPVGLLPGVTNSGAFSNTETFTQIEAFDSETGQLTTQPLVDSGILIPEENRINKLLPIPSLQVGDIAFYVTPSAVEPNQAVNPNLPLYSQPGNIGYVLRSANQEDIVTIGKINKIFYSNVSLTVILECDISADTPAPTTTDFVFFAKDNTVNSSSLLGYFSSVKFKNNSKKKAELFSVACEISPSSK